MKRELITRAQRAETRRPQAYQDAMLCFMMGTATAEDFKILAQDKLSQYRTRIHRLGARLRVLRDRGARIEPTLPIGHAVAIASYLRSERVPPVHGQELIRFASYTVPEAGHQRDIRFTYWAEAHVMLVCLDGPTGRAIRGEVMPDPQPVRPQWIGGTLDDLTLRSLLA